MADLRAQLREIETATPPDLWAGIVARADEEGPEMDGTVVAFRKDGSEWRRRAATALVAAAVFVVGFVVVWRAFQPAPTVLPPGGDPLPAGFVRCTNDVIGYSIGHPGDLHTTNVFNGDADPANACMWFSPDPFGPEGNVVPEGWGYPLEVAVVGPLNGELERLLDPQVAQTVEQDELMIDGHRAVRVEYETLVDTLAEPGLHYSYLVELDPETTLVVHTTDTRGIVEDYEEAKSVVDLAAGTLRFDVDGPSPSS
ncbi:MAG TPA: hypothetical protein VFZ75_02160 [Actinomycetota bacterium]|nr:hypothetical protein [Actinomycetota bacterium]